jgi:hypothetical protein
VYLSNDQPVADGFDFPVGDPDGQGAYVDQATGKRFRGWTRATEFLEEIPLGIHPGEDWNGRGGGDSDLGQPVHAIGAGRVVRAEAGGPLWGNLVVVRHVYYQNHHKRTVDSLYAHLREIAVAPGEDLSRRQRIGSIGKDPDGRYHAHLHLELRADATLSPTFWPSSNGWTEAQVKQAYRKPSAFIRERRRLFVPAAEPELVLIDHHRHRLRHYRSGTLVRELEISLGQGEGRKRRRGDLRTPKGMYFVVERRRGSFGGTWGDYYGGHWIKINYPNRYDARWGLDQGLITPSAAARIQDAWERRQSTDGGTGLGGGIGFHGWAYEWEDGGERHLSFGCVVLHPRDIGDFFRRLPVGAMVVIF